MPEFIERQYKSILNKQKFIDSWFWDRYSLNPYNGCQFGCVYCDARSARYFMPEDFERKIIIKSGAGEMLQKRLANARKLLPDVVGIGGVTDCYQAAEKKYLNTRQCLEVLTKYRYPVHIVTKSELVLRDLDLLEEIGRQSWCCVSVTITTRDTEVARFLDGSSPSPQQRFDVVRRIKKQAPHVLSGVLLIPLVPVLCDSEPQLLEMVKTTSDSGADYLLFGGGMTLRDRQGLWFLKHLVKSYPHLLSDYEALYNFKYDPDSYHGNPAPAPLYCIPKQTFLIDACRNAAIATRIPRFIPADFRATNYRLAEVLLNEAYEKQMRGESWQNLFWAGQNIQNLGEAIESVHHWKELGQIRNIRGEIKERVVSFFNSGQKRMYGDAAD